MNRVGTSRRTKSTPNSRTRGTKRKMASTEQPRAARRSFNLSYCELVDSDSENDSIIAISVNDSCVETEPADKCDDVINISDLLEEAKSSVVDLTNLPSPLPVPKKTEDTVADREQSQKQLECPICFEKLTGRPVSVTPCGHYFCTDCIKGALKNKKTCPTCRKQCYVKKLYPLFIGA